MSPITNILNVFCGNDQFYTYCLNNNLLFQIWIWAVTNDYYNCFYRIGNVAKGKFKVLKS